MKPSEWLISKGWTAFDKDEPSLGKWTHPEVAGECNMLTAIVIQDERERRLAEADE